MLKSKDLSPALWLWLPIIVMVIQVLLEIILPPEILGPLHSESGPHEAFQFIILLFAFWVGGATLCRLDWKTYKWPGLWILLATLCCLYVGGEEISWGQHILKWSTPEYWSALNDQNETNLHNTSSWLDQKPRLILLVGVIAGGLIIPFLRRFKPSILPKRFEIIYPPSVLAVTALLAVLIHAIDMIDKELKDIVIFQRASEVEELYLFYFVLLYLVVLCCRMVKNQR